MSPLKVFTLRRPLSYSEKADISGRSYTFNLVPWLDPY